jgi:hypothetical protein
MSEESRQGGQSNSGSGRNINTGGGMYNENGTINNSGGVNVFGGQTGDITYHDNRISASDAAQIQELLSSLQQHVQVLPAATPAEKEIKAEAEEATQALHDEVEEIKKDPDHKPKRITMNGMLAAFKKVGGPVLSTALSIIGHPALGAAVNQFAQNIPEKTGS